MGMNETNDRKQEGPYKGVETQGKGRQSLTAVMHAETRLKIIQESIWV